jgi:hypothetical protein
MLPAGPHQHLSKQHQCGLLDAWLQLYKQVGNQALAQKKKHWLVT